MSGKTLLRIFCLSGWGKLPDAIYWPQLIPFLESQGHVVIRATEPASDGDITRHIANLDALVKKHGGLGRDTAFIGQSIGSQIIMRYLASREEYVGQVKAWIGLGAWHRVNREMPGIEPWCQVLSEDQQKKLLDICPNILAMMSTDDEIVNLGEEQAADWRARIPWAKLHVASNRGHYIVPELTEEELTTITNCLSNEL